MFGRTVRERRIQLGLSQEDLARRAGVDVKTIGNVEAGRTLPRPSTRRLLTSALQAADGAPRGLDPDSTDGSGVGTDARWPIGPATGNSGPVNWELLHEIADAVERKGFLPPSRDDLIRLGTELGRILRRPIVLVGDEPDKPRWR